MQSHNDDEGAAAAAAVAAAASATADTAASLLSPTASSSPRSIPRAQAVVEAAVLVNPLLLSPSILNTPLAVISSARTEAINSAASAPQGSYTNVTFNGASFTEGLPRLSSSPPAGLSTFLARRQTSQLSLAGGVQEPADVSGSGGPSHQAPPENTLVESNASPSISAATVSPRSRISREFTADRIETVGDQDFRSLTAVLGTSPPRRGAVRGSFSLLASLSSTPPEAQYSIRSSPSSSTFPDLNVRGGDDGGTTRSSHPFGRRSSFLNRSIHSEPSEPPLEYGKIIVLGYKASLTAFSTGSSKVQTLREGGSHTFYLHRRSSPNGFSTPKAVHDVDPDLPSSQHVSNFLFNLQVNPKDSPLITMIQPIAQLMQIIPNHPSDIIPDSPSTSHPSSARLERSSSFHQQLTPQPRQSISILEAGSSDGRPQYDLLSGRLEDNREGSFRSPRRRHSSMSVGDGSIRSIPSEEVVGGSSGSFGNDMPSKTRCIALKSPSDPSKYIINWCKHSESTDLFQMGREAGQGVDMLVPGPSYIRQRSSWSAESSGPRHSPFLMTSHQPRFPFRLLCSRSAPYTTRIFAGAFDAQGRLVLGKKSIRFTAGHKTRRDWRMSTPSTNISSISVDALPESSVLVWRRDWIDPGASRWSRSELKGRWVEVSAVRGNAYSLRPDPKSKGQKIEELDDGEDGLNLGDEAIIYAGGVCFWWKSSQGKGEIDEVGVSSQASEKKSMAAKTWGLESFSEMMQDFERKVICPVTLDNILVDHMAESISGRSLKPWSRLFTRLRWTQEAAGNESTEADNALNLQEALSACSDVGEGQNLVTKRPWVFIACGHVVSFIEPKFLRPVVEERRRSLIGGGQDVENAAQEAEATAEANQAAYAFDPQSAAAAISALRTHCVVCRTVSRFVPLVARAQPDLLCGPAAFVFDPCGHVIHEEGATMWGREVAVPRLATVARDANGVIRTTAKAHGIGTPVIGTDLEAPAVTDTAAVCGPVRVEEYPGFSLFGSAPRAGGTGGWCHFCPFCATETVGVRRLYCVTE